MKIKLLLLFLMTLMMISIVQPIFAETQMHATTISSNDGGINFWEFRAYRGINTHLEAMLWKHEYSIWTGYPRQRLWWRYLNFYVYQANEDGSNGELMFHDRESTNFFGTAKTKKFALNHGEYNVLITYEGNSNDELSPSSATVKMHVL